MESLKRSVSYSQPNICASQAAINLAPLLAQLASVCGTSKPGPASSTITWFSLGPWVRRAGPMRVWGKEEAVPSLSAPSGGHIYTQLGV